MQEGDISDYQCDWFLMSFGKSCRSRDNAVNAAGSAVDGAADAVFMTVEGVIVHIPDRHAV